MYWAPLCTQCPARRRAHGRAQDLGAGWPNTPATDPKGREEATRPHEMRKGSCLRSEKQQFLAEKQSPYSEGAESRSGWSLELPVALGGSIHVVPDADGLFEKTLHAAEVDAAVNKALHSAETGGWTQLAPPHFTLPPSSSLPCLSLYPPNQRLAGGLQGLSAQQAPWGSCGPP